VGQARTNGMNVAERMRDGDRILALKSKVTLNQRSHIEAPTKLVTSYILTDEFDVATCA
jgi:hypothetical protein